MPLIFVIFIFIFGLCVGSFINCLVYRINKNKERLKGIFWGRSFCDHCRHKLSWKDNIPLFSFVLLKGKCRYCHSPISWQYPIVELTTGVLFVGAWWWVRNWCGENLNCYIVTLVHCYIFASLIALFVSDLRYQTIPDLIVYPAILISLLYAIPNTQYAIPTAIGTVLFFLALVLITQGKGMGMGDVKLAGLMGLVLGWPKIIIALYLAFLTGAIVGVILILLGKKHFGEHIPFGPFLATATFVSLFYGNQTWEWLLRLLKW